MRCLFLYVNYLLIVWVLASTVSKAQEITYLKLQSDRLYKAREAEKEARKKNDPLLLAEAFYLYGKTYVFAGDYRTAQAYYLKSLRIQEPRGDSFELSRLYVRLCESEERMGHFSRALQYATLSLAVAQRLQTDRDNALIRSYGAFAHVYETMWSGQSRRRGPDFNRILSYYRKREFLCYKLNDTLGVAEVSLELGTLFAKVKDPRAIPYFEKALYLFTINHKDGIQVNTMMHLASAYLNFGKLERAFRILRDAEQIYADKKLNEYEIRLGLETQFVRYYEASGKWQQAFDRLKKLNELEKIKLLADQNGAITRLNVEYETEKREGLLEEQKKAIDLHTQNLQLHRRFAIATSALFIIAAGMSLVFFRLYRKNQRISRRNEDLVKEQNHRVKNNLQVVSSLLSLQSKRLSDESARKAIEESRLRVQSMAILHQRLYDGDKLAEANLDEFIREVVTSVLKAYGYPTLKVQFSIGDISLAADKAVPLGLILNELTTNACKYAFPTTNNPAFSIGCYRESTKIHMIVADNGPGFGAEQTNTSWSESTMAVVPVSFGMQLIQAQVAQLAGTYTFNTNPGGADTGIVFSLEFKG